MREIIKVSEKSEHIKSNKNQNSFDISTIRKVKEVNSVADTNKNVHDTTTIKNESIASANKNTDDKIVHNSESDELARKRELDELDRIREYEEIAYKRRLEELERKRELEELERKRENDKRNESQNNSNNTTKNDSDKKTDDSEDLGIIGQIITFILFTVLKIVWYVFRFAMVYYCIPSLASFSWFILLPSVFIYIIPFPPLAIVSAAAGVLCQMAFLPYCIMLFIYRIKNKILIRDLLRFYRIWFVKGPFAYKDLSELRSKLK